MYSVLLSLHLSNSYSPNAFLITEVEKKQVRHILMQIYYQPCRHSPCCWQLCVIAMSLYGELGAWKVICDREWKGTEKYT